jgi:hypothetical protein
MLPDPASALQDTMKPSAAELGYDDINLLCRLRDGGYRMGWDFRGVKGFEWREQKRALFVSGYDFE